MAHRARDLLKLQARVFKDIATGRELKDCLEDLCQIVEAIVPGGKCCTMVLDDTPELHVVAAPSLSAELAKVLSGLVPGETAGSCGTAVYLERPVFVADTLTDPLWEAYRDVARKFEIRACWSVPTLGNAGQVLGTVSISHSVTCAPNEEHLLVLDTASFLAGIAIDRWREHLSLQASAHKYHELFEHAPDMCLILDRDDVVQECNAAALRVLGYGTEAEVVGVPIRDLLVREPIAGHSSEYEAQVRSKNGRVIDVSLIRTPIFGGDGPDQRSLMVWRDQTERKRSEATLQQSRRLASLGILAGGIAHDFNNLLVGILGNVQLASRALPENSPLQETLCDIETSSQHAADLTRNLMTYAGGTGIGVRPQPQELRELVTKAVALGPASPESVEVELQLDHGGFIQADPPQILQVLSNLLTNAEQAVRHDGSKVRVRTGVQSLSAADLQRCLASESAEPAEYGFIEIRDDGPGMDSETLQHIFDPFFTTKKTGRGLGLAAALGIVKRHRGALKVESEPGKGSCFTVYCPSSKTKPALTPPPQHDATSPPSLQGCVLVVDDEEIVLRVTSKLLERSGARVLRATQGLAAIQLLRADPHAVDAVVLDLRMPEMTGSEVFEALRSIRPDLPILFYSGGIQGESERRLLRYEQTAFITKPFSRNDLVRAVSQLLPSPPTKNGVPAEKGVPADSSPGKR